MSFPEQTAPPPSGGEPAERVKVEPLSFVPRRTRSQRRESELHICPTCGSDLVYPTDWAPADERSWTVNLRCPDCEWLGDGTYTQEVVDRFDVELDRGTDMLIEDLARLMRANMEDEIERFISALYADHIVAEDF